ncbi:hypothetical protein BJX99DRAFT_240862, partial [Aspergillus californicus]
MQNTKVVQELRLKSNLPDVRELDWGLDKCGNPITQTAISVPHVGAVLLQTKGEIQSDTCDHCVTRGPFRECVAGLEYQGAAVFAGACALYVWHNQVKNCSIRTIRGLN